MGEGRFALYFSLNVRAVVFTLLIMIYLPIHLFGECTQRRERKISFPVRMMLLWTDLAKHTVCQIDRFYLLLKVHLGIDFGRYHAAVPQNLFDR